MRECKITLDFTSGLFVEFVRFIQMQSRMIEDRELLPLITNQGIVLSRQHGFESKLNERDTLTSRTSIDNPEAIYALSLLCSSTKISTDLRDAIRDHLLLVLLDIPRCSLPSGLDRAAFFSAGAPQHCSGRHQSLPPLNISAETA